MRGTWRRVEELKQRIAGALDADDLAAAGALFEELRRVDSPVDPDSLDQQLATGCVSNEFLVSAFSGFRAWAAAALDHPQKVQLAETERRRKVLSRWFECVELRGFRTGFEMNVIPGGSAPSTRLSVDYGQWRLALDAAGYRGRPRTPWTAEEIIDMFHRWVEQHGQSPYCREWRHSTPEHPMYQEVRRFFGTWRAGLAAAGYQPRPRRDWRRTRDRLGRFVSREALPSA